MSDTQEKDKLAPSSVLDSTGAPSLYQNTLLFKGNESFLFAFKKSQKLAAAVYLVTDLVPEEEKIRRELRDLSVTLVKDILSAANLRQHSLLPVRILEIISLLEIASGARLISSMNADILKREYEQILNIVSKTDQHLPAPTVNLSEELLKTDTLPVLSPLPTSSVVSGNYLNSAHLAPQMPAHMSLTQRPSNIGHKGHSVPVSNERSLSILELIKKSPQPLSIKEIVAHIRGVGEKTVQRELGALVARNVLKREGERRWSRYSLR